MTRVYLTTTIPYVNAAPHLGFALEAVQADVLARHHRARGHQVRLLTGTDDNSLKNVLAAEQAGLPVQDFVDSNAARFAALREPLALSYDDFIRTSRDPRHRPGVEALWRACAHDLYQDTYEGLYCVGCEHYLTPDELDGSGHCPEHRTPPQRITEQNWFFRLSRYAAPLREAITGGRLRIEPESRRNEVLAFIDAGLRDFSVSRSQARARGWGITVPDDPGQVIYVWWDALGNYLTALGYGSDGDAYRTWWEQADRRVHVIGKGVLRFHAVYWPAILLSAGLPLPTDILIHDYLTAGGQKISKSSGTPVDPVALAGRYGTDAVRCWLLREVPRVGDADFTVDRLVERADADLAGGAGNLVNRVVTMVHRYRAGLVPADAVPVPEAKELVEAVAEAPWTIAAGLDDFDFRRAAAAVWAVVEEANRFVEQTRPWELAKAERSGDPDAGVRLDGALAALLTACRAVGDLLAPFLPGASALVTAQCTPGPDGTLPPPAPLFPRLTDS
ncbi:methionine--tRNA ligase [Catellatospora bangladeshensis]|uniref:methionine--tRNA ligase n=1 Tax=Catellatospora bangladeshensis TaxID=310355 RepID=A0A8J3JIJ5_9ACTN|nr:methionine--tRNA ligase [Catellatospora bangladeshensis]GIF81082.1 methionine--tRNA ligase [Catellatospora bangladeshensis]